ncbi:MAG: polysaccharide deacetylase family protein [Methylococcaceae bacterium]|nr:polysaccharide deacetylase family protein [Methylococcaceae bacterium]
MQSLILLGLKQLATIASGLGKKKKLFILIFHRVLDEPDFMRPGEVDKKIFTWQMQLLAKYFNVLPLADALDKLDQDQLPSRAVCITFDDGYADNYLNALAILKQHNLTATFFIATGYLNGGIMWNDKVIEAVRNMQQIELDLTAIELGKLSIASEHQKYQVAQQIIQKIKHLQPKQRSQYAEGIAQQSQGLPNDLMMTDNQLKSLHQSGMEIGGHTVTHPILATLNAQEVEQEIVDNKAELERLLETRIDFFAYPNGRPEQDYLKEHISIVKNAGYKAAVSTPWGVLTKQTDRYQLPRFTPWDKQEVKFMLRMILTYMGR